jgi:hypothetical protein
MAVGDASYAVGLKIQEENTKDCSTSFTIVHHQIYPKTPIAYNVRKVDT